MPTVEIRSVAHQKNPTDLTLTIQDKTFEYLVEGNAPSIRVSAYFDRDWEMVKEEYAELFVSEKFSDQASLAWFQIKEVIPGSRFRKPTLPGEMKNGEQLTLVVTRVPR